MGRKLSWISAVLALSLALPASAESPDDAAKLAARTLANTGRQRFEAGDYAGALEALRDAEKYFHAPTITRMRALAHEKLGQLLEALELHERVVAEKLEVTAPVEFVKARDGSAASVTSLQTRIPKLQITVAHAPSGTRVALDGTTVDASKLGSEIRLNPGKHTVSVEPPAGAKVTREVDLKEQSTEKVEIDLAPPNSTATASTASSAPPDGGAGSKAGGGSFVGPAIAFGLGGAGLVVGAIMGGLTFAKAGEIRQLCGTDLVCNESDKRKVDLEGAKALGYVSTAGFVLAGVGAITGVTLLLVAGPKKSGPSRAALAFGPGFARLEGTF